MNNNQIIDMANESGYFWDRLLLFKQEILENIIDLLVQNNITELNLPTEPDEDGVVWFIWRDNDDKLYNTPVQYICLEGKSMYISVKDSDKVLAPSLDASDLNHYHLGCLCSLLDAITKTLKSKNDDE